MIVTFCFNIKTIYIISHSNTYENRSRTEYWIEYLMLQMEEVTQTKIMDFVFLSDNH